MKKLMLVLAFVFCFSAYGFSLPTASGLSLGFGYGNFFDVSASKEITTDGYIGGPGLNFKMHQFNPSDNVAGSFVIIDFGFPCYLASNVNGIKTTADISSYNRMHIGLSGGGCLRKKITDIFYLDYGIGGHIMLKYLRFFNDDIIHSFSTLGLGIGGEICIKFDLTDVFFLNFAGFFAFDFLLRNDWYETEVRRNAVQFVLTPYICIGLNAYHEDGKYKIGKPGK